MSTASLKKWGIPLLGIAAALLIAKTAGIFSLPATKTLVAQSAVTVTTAQAGYVTKKPKLLLTGSLEGETSVVISPKISGRIERVNVQDGQPVSAGEELITLESVELSNSVRMNLDMVARASASYENIKADYIRYRTLFEQNAVSRQQLDSVETRLKVAETDLSSAYASLSSARQQFAYSSITAPLAGVVANKSATLGQVVAAGQQLMTLESINWVYAVVNIEQKAMGTIRTGMPAEIQVDAYPGEVFHGSVQVINPTAATANRMFRTKVLLDNKDGRLKPGMFVKAGIITGADSSVLAIPRTAMLQKQGLYYVFTLEDNKAKRREIGIGEVI